MNVKAATERLNISADNTSAEIFGQVVAAFRLPFTSVDDYHGKDTKRLVEALISTIKHVCHSAEISDHTIHNLQAMIDKNNETIATLKEERDEAKKILEENQNASLEMMKQHRKSAEENNRLEKENKELLRQNQKLTEELAYLRKDKFGAKSEKLDDLKDHVLSGQENTDPLSEEDTGAGGETPERKGNKNPSGKPKGKGSGTKKSKEKGKKKNDLSSLPTQTVFEYDIDELNKKYGEGKWRFAFWKSHSVVEVLRTTAYVKIIMTPSISIGVEHTMETVPYEAPLWQKSCASQSLLTDMIMEKFRKYVPLYRLENTCDRYGFHISRQTMSNWVNRAALEFLLPVYLYLQSLLVFYPYQQCDETTWNVLRDGRKSGARSYFWTHRSSELYTDKPPIVLYALELTRSRNHLERFYKELIEKGGTKVHLTSDAYQPYHTLEDNHPEIFESCGCFSHDRRRYVTPFTLLAQEKLSEDELFTMDEWKALDMITSIYAEEMSLKDLAADVRLKLRQEKVKPLIETYFEFIKSLDIEDPKYSEAFKDAITYSINQERYLCRFLEDGNVPIDDNATERNQRPVTLIRKNSLFSNTVEGGMANAIILTLIETARANDVDPYFYIKYILDYMPARYYANKLDEKIETMVPWAEEFMEYVRIEKQKEFERSAPKGNDKPHTPRKKDHIQTSEDHSAMA